MTDKDSVFVFGKVVFFRRPDQRAHVVIYIYFNRMDNNCLRLQSFETRTETIILHDFDRLGV